jgi:hypothetical protein
MNLLNKILPTYNYHCFDRFNQFQVVPLNIIDLFFRRVFGWYADTHLANVVKRAYGVTLTGDLPAATPQKKQELLKLIAKAQDLFGYSQSHMKLSDCPLSNGSQMGISVRYSINKPSNKDGSFKISSVDFELFFKKNNRNEAQRSVSFFKNRFQRFVAYLPRDLFQGSCSSDTEESITRRLNGEHAKKINHLLAKILNDSSSVPEMRYYAADYQSIPIGSTRGSIFETHLTPDTQNTFQNNALHQLGWEYLEHYAKSDVKQVYLLRKETVQKKQLLTAMGFNQNLSLDFAASVLETQSRDY